MKNPIITITMENGDVMKAELYPEVAPNTVNNFLSLIGKGFYDGLIFHRVIKGFMIQGGCRSQAAALLLFTGKEIRYRFYSSRLGALSNKRGGGIARLQKPWYNSCKAAIIPEIWPGR